jgi:hypothetical protein
MGAFFIADRVHQLRKLSMSFIQIMDLDCGDRDSLITLNTAETAMIVGGTAIAPSIPLTTPVALSSIIAPLTSASSINISSFSQNNILNFGTNTKFNTSFTVDATGVKPAISGSIDIRFLNPSAPVSRH